MWEGYTLAFLPKMSNVSIQFYQQQIIYIWMTYFLDNLKQQRTINFINIYYIVIYRIEYITADPIHSLIWVSTQSLDKKKNYKLQMTMNRQCFI